MLNQKAPVQKYVKLIHGDTVPALRQMQRIIGESQLFEPEANLLLRSAGLPEIASYLAFSYQLKLDPDFFPAHDLGQLLLTALHSEFLDVNIKQLEIERVNEEFALNRHIGLTDDEFRKLKDFIDFKVSPLITERNYQSLATGLTENLIDPCVVFDERTKLLLKEYICQIAHVGEVRYHYYKVLHDTLPVRMKGEREKQKFDSSLDITIQDLRSNWRVEHPTKFEQLLNAFRARNYQPMQTEEIGQLLFRNNSEPERAVQMMISKLNTKLEKLELKIERFSSYEIRKVEKPKHKT